MRTDITIDSRKIPCPEASLLGHSYGAAKPGHCITYYRPGSSSGIQIGRVLGRVTTYSQVGKASVKGWALVMRLSDDGTYASEDWVDPEWITRIFDSPAKMAQFFFMPELPYDVHTMRRLMEHGTTQEQFIDQHVERVGEFRRRDVEAEAEKEKGCQTTTT